MNNFFELQLKAAIIIALMVVVFVVFFANDRLFMRNRTWLLSSLIVPWIMPFVAMPAWLRQLIIDEKPTNTFVFLPEMQTEATLPAPAASHYFTWQEGLLALFIIISLFFFFRLLMGYVHLFRLKRKQSGTTYKGHQVVLLNNDGINPFSFFQTIFISKSLMNDSKSEMILEHERTHCAQHHSIDISLAEWLLILQWWNPFAWWLRKLIAQNHEFCVDQAMTKVNDRTKSYQYALLSLLQGDKQLQLVNNFNQSLIKKRIVMMNTKHTNLIFSWLKTALLAPLSFALLLAFTNSDAKAQNEEDIKSSNELRRFFATNIKYPVTAQSKGITGTVRVNFEVDKNGKVGTPVFDKKRSNDEEALEVVVVAYNTSGKKSTSTNTADLKPLKDEVRNVLHKIPGISDINLKGKEVAMDFKFMLQGKDEQATKDKPSFKIKMADGRTMTTGPIFIIDGKTKKNIDGIDPNSIKSINVLKDESALAVYGEKGKNGVVIINSKGSATLVPPKNTQHPPFFLDANGTLNKDPLVIVDNVEYTGNLNDISADQIQSVSVLKNEAATSLYGEKAKDGVILITTKKQ